MVQKPMVVRMLEQRGIPHELFAFDPAIRSAEEVALSTGMDLSEVYKTLVVEGDPPKGKPSLVLVPADSELNLKALATAMGVKKLRMASHADAERATGLKVGGISALALLNKGFVVYIDARATEIPHILVSAGERGFDVRIAVAELLQLTGATPLAGIGLPVHTGGRPQRVSGTSRALGVIISSWPDRRVPQGGLSRAAREAQVSRQIVALAARSHGFQVDASLPPEVERAEAPPHRAVQILLARYPSKSLPRGALTEVAEELGLQPSAVAKVAHKAGFRAGTTAAVAVLAERFPDRRLPRGEVGRVAAEMGLSEKVLRKAANRAGFRVGATPGAHSA